ncbi:MAG: nuclear transport factor 2 family protein [Methylobacteriaceae bacterium]|nr:nuclear transport factor 2 family protein [Methylobacteriaceae bacterium]
MSTKEEMIAVWEEHLKREFITREPDAPPQTMTADAIVNHVPTMTGGVGIAEVRQFYREHMVTVNPNDLEIMPVSRTVGDDAIVDELVVSFTHSRVMDYLLPGIAATGKRVQIPVVSVVHFRDGKIASERVYWDQASVLVQVGALDAADLPVAGVEIALKVLDPNLPSNTLIDRLS